MQLATRGEITRYRIEEEAFQLFLQCGFHGTSMRQVAKQAEVTPASIYNHFESKEDLFLSVLLQRVPHRALLRALADAEGQDAESLVHDAYNRLQDALAGQLDNFRLLLVEITDFQGRHAATVAEEFLPEALAFIARLKTKDPRLEAHSPVLLMRSFVGLFISYAITTTLLKDVQGLGPDPAGLASLGDVFLHGVLR